MSNFDLKKKKTFKKFFDKSVQILNEDPDLQYLPSSQPKSLYGLLCQHFHGFYDKSKSLTIHSWFKRNQKNLATKVDAAIEKNKTCFKLNFDSEEAKKIVKSLIGGKERKFLRSGFTDMLNSKLKEKNIACWLKCKFNWIGVDSTKGKYYCISCLVYFDFSIATPLEKDLSFTAHLFYKDKITNHENVTSSDNSIRGQKRKEVALSLKSEGVLNFMNNLKGLNYY